MAAMIMWTSMCPAKPAKGHLRTQFRSQKHLFRSAACMQRSKPSAVQAFKVTWKNLGICASGPDGNTQEMECDEDTYLLDAAENSACSGYRKVESGKVDNSDQQMLTEEQASQQFILTCVAYPKSDVTILTDQEENLY